MCDYWTCRLLAPLQPSGRSTPDQDRQRLKTGSVFGKEGINDKEIYAKMERLTEETIMRNLQLMTDIKVLGDEVVRISDENKKLRAAAAAPTPTPAPTAAPVASPPPVYAALSRKAHTHTDTHTFALLPI